MSLFARFNPRRSLTARIILFNLALVLLALGSFMLWTGWRLQQSIISDAEAELEVRSLIVANGLKEPVLQQLAYEEAHEENEHSGEELQEHTTPFVAIGDRDFKSVVDSYARDLHGRITILDSALTVRYASDPQVPLNTAETHPEILAALAQQEEHDIRYDEVTGEKRIFVAAPILDASGVKGVVQLSIPFDDVSGRLQRMWLTLLSAGMILAILFVLASIFLGEQITQPLQRLTAAAHRLATGDLGVRLEMERQDELGELASAFDHMAEEISQLLARERAFVANASHELRSPVTAIQLRAELLQMAGADDVRRERYLGDIRQESENLGRLLQQLLDLDRMQSSPEREAGPMDIASCLRQIIDLMAPLARHAGLTLTADIPQSLPMVRISQQDCEIIFRNLLDNAIKYTPENGRVQLVARATDDTWTEIVVRDTGMGIPAQDLSHIFDRFYRVDKARDRTGSGLGLALVKEIVTQAGGKIQAESTEGSGTTMTVQLPNAT